MNIAVASGKGGTGKSTISTNLAYLLSEEYKDVAIIDCDVEEPNCHIFLKPLIEKTDKTYSEIPKIDNLKCNSCRKCIEVCEFNALAMIGKELLVFPELCHSCGACWELCPNNSMTRTHKEIGIIEQGRSDKLYFIHGKTKIGEPMSPPLIKKIKQAGKKHKIQIWDCPPGTSCPVINAVEGADIVLMVTEPTPFGLYDLKLAIDVMNKLKKQIFIIINKSSENDEIIDSYAKENNIKILTRIPDDKRIAVSYSNGALILKELPEYITAFKPIIEIIEGIKE
jgi:MinD superfamily P-loop ATPase